MRRIGDYAIGYQGDEDEFENYIDKYPIVTKREIWEQAYKESKKQVASEIIDKHIKFFIHESNDRNLLVASIVRTYGLGDEV